MDNLKLRSGAFYPSDEMLWAIWYDLYNLKNVKSTHGGVLLLVKLQAEVTKSNTFPWVFFTFFKLYKKCCSIFPKMSFFLHFLWGNR